MKVLKTFPPQRFVIAITLIALVATVLLWLQFAPFEEAMQAHDYGIVDYELAFTAERVGTILAAWGAAGQDAAYRSLLLDFAFMPAYALLFAGLTLLMARAQPPGFLQTAGWWLAPAQLIAALFDVLENLLLLSMLGLPVSVPAASPQIAGLAASLKFTLLALALLYWLIGGIARILRVRSQQGA